MTATADVVDEHGNAAAICAITFRQFGGRREFEGEIATVRCYEDNVLLNQRLSEPGNGRVLVVEGAGSLRAALAGEKLANLARDNGWGGLVIHGCVRDAAALAEIDLGVKALGTCPRASGKTGTGELDAPVAFGGVTFRPGALLFSDDDGIVVLEA